MQKRYTLKVYSLAGTYLKTFNPKDVLSEVSFTSVVAGGQGQCIVNLKYPLDNFGEGSSIKHMNVVKIYEADDTYSLTPRLIYTGYISRYTPYFSSQGEGVKLTLLGLVSLLSLSYFKNGASYPVTKTTTDPTQIMKDVIDHFASVYGGGWLSYSGGKVDAVGTNVSYEFVDTKWLDALKVAFNLAGGSRYWRIAEDGQLWVKVYPASRTHLFTLGDDVESGEIVKNNEQVVNYLQLRYGPGPTVTNYQDAASQAAYGLRERLQTDPKITDATTANQYGNGQIADLKDAKVSARLRISSKYNIESIKPGDTCSVMNKLAGSTTFPDNMKIVSVSYTPDYVDLELDNPTTTFADNFNAAVAAA